MSCEAQYDQSIRQFFRQPIGLVSRSDSCTSIACLDRYLTVADVSNSCCRRRSIVGFRSTRHRYFELQRRDSLANRKYKSDFAVIALPTDDPIDKRFDRTSVHLKICSPDGPPYIIVSYNLRAQFPVFCHWKAIQRRTTCSRKASIFRRIPFAHWLEWRHGRQIFGCGICCH